MLGLEETIFKCEKMFSEEMGNTIKAQTYQSDRLDFILFWAMNPNVLP